MSHSFSPQEWFNTRYVPEPNTGCWLWLGYIYPKTGYGDICRTKGHELAHRFSYRLHKGPIPVGLQLDHLCRVRSCVNPSHLEAVTARTNQLRGGDTLAAKNARKTECPRGHPYSGDNLYIERGSRMCKKCRIVRNARRYKTEVRP